MSFSVRLDVFEGPLDLLLQLVSAERVDVASISISTITDEYLKAVREMGELDLELATGFLVLAATLLELKSLRLLPDREAGDPEVAAVLEERDHLLHGLVEYSTFKRAAAALARYIRDNEGYHYPAPDPPEELVSLVPDVLEGVTPERLAEAGARALSRGAREATRPVDTSFIAPIRVSVREMIDLLAERVRREGRTSFRELCREATSRIELVVRFLALLELFRVESVDLEQRQPFEDIVVRWREPHPGRR